MILLFGHEVGLDVDEVNLLEEIFLREVVDVYSSQNLQVFIDYTLLVDGQNLRLLVTLLVAKLFQLPSQVRSILTVNTH